MAIFATGGKTWNMPKISGEHSNTNFKVVSFLRLACDKYMLIFGLLLTFLLITNFKMFSIIPINVSGIVSSSYEEIVNSKDTGFTVNTNALAVFTDMHSILFMLATIMLFSIMMTLKHSTIKNQAIRLFIGACIFGLGLTTVSCALEVSKQKISSTSFSTWMDERYGFEPTAGTEIKVASDLTEGTLQKDKTTNIVSEIRKLNGSFYLYDPLTGNELPIK